MGFMSEWKWQWVEVSWSSYMRAHRAAYDSEGYWYFPCVPRLVPGSMVIRVPEEFLVLPKCRRCLREERREEELSG